MTKYWVVGASWGGTDHQDQRFTQEGFWMLGWEEGHQPGRAAEMKAGDRIAIKRLKGQGQKGIRIKHLGVIKGVILDTNRVICTVDWVAKASTGTSLKVAGASNRSTGRMSTTSGSKRFSAYRLPRGDAETRSASRREKCSRHGPARRTNCSAS